LNRAKPTRVAVPIEEEEEEVLTDRLKMKINITQNFTTMVTGHGNKKIILVFTQF